jgi:hypothetical protein
VPRSGQERKVKKKKIKKKKRKEETKPLVFVEYKQSMKTILILR